MNQIGAIIPSLISLAKQFSHDQFFDITNIVPGFDNICLWLPSLFFYFLHVALRGSFINDVHKILVV